MDQSQALKNLIMANEDGARQQKVEPTFHFMAHKAGMQQVDKEKVSAVIAEASRDSRFYNKQMKKKEKYEQDIEKMKEKIEKVKKDKQQVLSIQTIANRKLEDLEKTRDLKRTWVHVDMDMFFVACEIRDRPELKDKPVAVGGIGMLSTANYVARSYGVRSAMPGFIALKLCPELVIVKGDFQKYKETSKRFKKIIEEYDPEYESGGLDEAVLDLTDYLTKHSITTAEEIEKVCYDMRMRINEATGITCSCGIGPNKMLAKLSTEIGKPNGQYYMKPNREEILQFINRLPVRKIPGIGSFGEQMLGGLGITTCKGILDNLVDVHIAFTEITFNFFLRAALGLSRSYHEEYGDRKSISVSRTFPAISDVAGMENKVREIAGMLAEDLVDCKKKTRHLTLTIKTHNFDVKNRGTPIEKFTDDEKEIATVCLKLLKELLPLEPLRLLGIKAANLSGDEGMKSLDSFFKKAPTNKNTNSGNGNNDNINNNINDDNSNPLDEFADLSYDDIFPEDKEKENSMKLADMPIQEVDEDSRRSSLSTSGINKQNVDPPKEASIEHQSLSYQRMKGEDIICPVCQMKFESSINNSKINKHLDRCLSEPLPSTTTTPTADQSIAKAANVDKQEDPRKRKHEDLGQYPGNVLKKSKKTPPENNTIKKLDSFFTKK